MPGLKRRGPIGEGAMTGRRLGRCNPDNKGKTDEQINLSRESHPTAQSGQGLGMGGGCHRNRNGSGMGKGVGAGKRVGMRNRGNA